MLEASEIKSKIRFNSIFYTSKPCSQSLYQAASVSAQLQHNGGLTQHISSTATGRVLICTGMSEKRYGLKILLYIASNKFRKKRI